MSPMDSADRKNLLLLVQLRWLAVAGQVATIIVVQLWLDVPLPLLPMAVVVLFLIGLNLVSLLRLRIGPQVGNMTLFMGLLLDVAALTAQLYLSGGAGNPFISLYLLQVILGAVLLRPWSVWALVGLTTCCFLALTVVQQPLLLQNLERERDGGRVLGGNGAEDLRAHGGVVGASHRSPGRTPRGAGLVAPGQPKRQRLHCAEARVVEK